MPKYKQHIRIPTALFEHAGYKGLADSRKPYALAIIVMLLKYVNQKKGECYPRYAKIRKDLGCSKKTLTNYMHLLSTAGLIKIRRLSSTNLYTINPILLINEVYDIPQVGNMVHISGVPNAHINKTYLNKHILLTSNKMDNDNRIDDIINRYKNDKDVLISTLSKFLQTTPLAEHNRLLNNQTYKWYMKLVLEYRQQELRQKKLLPETVAKQRITEALKNNSKKRSERYVARVKYNKANGIKPWENKKNKF
jgi:hypothetical protein